MGSNERMELINFEVLDNQSYKLDGELLNFFIIDDYVKAFEVCELNVDKFNGLSSSPDIVIQFKSLIKLLIKILKGGDFQNSFTEFEISNLKNILVTFINDINLAGSLIENVPKRELRGTFNSSRNSLIAFKNRLESFVLTLYNLEVIKDTRNLIILDSIAENIINEQTRSKLRSDNAILKHELSELSAQLARYENTQQNKPAVDLYKDIKTDFLNLENRYRKYFVIAIITTLMITIGYNPLIGIWANVISLGCSFTDNYFNACKTLANPSIYPFNGETLKFIFFKFGVLVVGITFTTYFLRLSSFYQLKQEQAKQTQLELSAFPDYVSGMDESVANNLRQELALKYFGKEIDKTLIDKNGDLLQDQIKAGTELIKASTDVVKTVKPSGASDSSEPK